MAYSVSNDYKEIIYSQDDNNDIKIWFNEVELPNAGLYVEKVSGDFRILPNDGKKRFSLDNFISKEVELIIHDINLNLIQDQVRISIGTLVNNSYEYVPIGIFNIQNEPTTNNGKTTIKLRDNRVKFEFEYNAKPLIDANNGKATYRQILEDICIKAGVTNVISSFDGESIETILYDSTIKGNIYISYLAEQGGYIPIINRDGELDFIDLTNSSVWRIPLSIISNNYELGTPFSIERVCFEKGTIKFESSNNENLNTLYLNSANPYIINQNQINNIYNKLNGFTLDSVNFSQAILGNPAIDPCDIIEIYDDEDINETVIFRTLANHTYTFNGKHRQLFDTQIGKEQRKENVYKNSDNTFKYIIKDEINALDGSIIQIISETIDTDNPNSLVRKQSSLTRRVDTLESEISNVTGMTQTKESYTGRVTFDDITTASEPITIKAHPTSENISYLYPRDNLYPSDTLYLTNRRIRFNNTTLGTVIDYELPDDLLYYDNETYDEFYLDLNSQTCQVTKRCTYNADGSVSKLINERVDDYSSDYPFIELTEGVYSVYLLGYYSGYISVSLMAKNIYTDQFYTKVEADSKITQTANQITSDVSERYTLKTTTETLSTRINQTAKSISLTTSDNNTSAGINIKLYNEDGSLIDDKSANITLSGLVKFTDLSGNGTTTINGNNITTGKINTNLLQADVITTANFNIQNLNADNITSGTLTARAINNNYFKVTETGNVIATSGQIGGWALGSNSLTSGTGTSTVKIISSSSSDSSYAIVLGSETNSQAPFRVRRNGELYATNVHLSGEITATSGTIGGCSIVGNQLQVSNANIENLNVSKITSGTNAQNLTFNGSVTCNNLYASNSGTIGGFTIGSNSLSGSTSKGTMTIKRGTNASIDLPANGGRLMISSSASGGVALTSASSLVISDNYSHTDTGDNTASVGIRAIYGNIRIATNNSIKLVVSENLTIDNYTGQSTTIYYKDNNNNTKYMTFYKGLLVGYN